LTSGLAGAAEQANLARFLADAAGAKSAQIVSAKPLSGGAVQENWSLDVSFFGGDLAGRQALVLRTDAPTGVSESHDRAEEFALLSAAHAAGITVPEPLFLCPDREVIGRPFLVMRRVAGTAAGHRLVREQNLGGPHDQLAERLGRELARIHAIRPPRADLAFLGAAPVDVTGREIRRQRDLLDRYREPWPTFEWGLRWMERNDPGPEDVVLAHRDFRTGNYMVDETGLTAILDWEFSGWGAPHEDIAWFCAKCWRFGAFAQEAGGIADSAALYRGYEAESGRRVDPARIRWWEVAAHVRWGIIAMQQGRRVLEGGERSLDLAITGRRTAECELEIMMLLDAA
jgi:aminoglycoside phosphotransferase (APT) family kinase protein